MPKSCKVVATHKPQVWKDDFGWVCDQSTVCKTCYMASLDRLAEDVTWEEAMKASLDARPVEK